MAPSATATQSLSKIKRPVPPGIQTNGINSSTSSPSPSMSTGRLPSAAKATPHSATTNGNGTSAPRSANRNRRDGSSQLLGRGQRNGSVGVRSSSILGDSGAVQAPPVMPYGMEVSGCHRSLLTLHSQNRRVYSAEVPREPAIPDCPPTPDTL